MAYITDFAAQVDHARPYALQCGDLAGFAKSCFDEVERSGEPAFYLTTRKHFGEPHRFPASLEMWSYNELKGEAFTVASMDVERPNYKDNPFGFQGNHLVVALLEEVQRNVVELIPEGIVVLTSQSSWRALIYGSGYSELKAKRVLERIIPVAVKPGTSRFRL